LSRWIFIRSPVVDISALMPGALAVGAQEVNLVSTAPNRTALALTIYNKGTALVRDTRTYTLAPGLNTLNVTDVAEKIDSTSVQFVSLTDPTGTRVLEQNFVFDLVDPSRLVNRFIDQRIRVTATDGTAFEGVLLSGRGGSIVLLTDDGGVVTVQQDQIRDLRFPSLPGGLITRPTLRWLVESAAGGDQSLEMTYLTDGITWTADYIVLLARDNRALDLNGWVTLTNTSGAAYPEATVKLVAGDINRIQSQEALLKDTMQIEFLSVREPQVEQREFFEYQLYEIARPVTVGRNETKQVEFVGGAGIPATTYYVFEVPLPLFSKKPISERYAGTARTGSISIYLEFSTGKENGLGADLPAGRVRVYQEDIDGAALLIGENRIGHTPEGETVSLYLGNAFDLVGERSQTRFNLIANNILEETYEIRLRNRKDDVTVEIRVPETLFRWSNWRILESSLPFKQLDAHTIEFRSSVPPGGETVITYTVRYTLP
jgi:hypothetical protein